MQSQCPKHRVAYVGSEVQVLFFSFNNKTNSMQAMRSDALTELKRLAEEVRNSNFVYSDRKWKEELDNICIWASGDGSNSSLPEINKRIEDIKLKVRGRITLFCFSRNLNPICVLFFL